MKLKSTYIIRETGDDYIMMDASGKFSGIIHGNETAAFIAQCLKTETTREEIVQKMLEKYDVSRSEASESVDRVVEKLKGIGAIDG